MTELPDFYETVAEEIFRKCQPKEGLWIDLGAGPGRVGLALAKQTTSTIVLLDPNEGALQEALNKAQTTGLSKRVVAIKAQAEAIPLEDNCIDLVVSRGSIFFWNDKAQGIREVYRILRPGGVAMIGGGLGMSYPEWARREFTRRRYEEIKSQGPEAYRRFILERSPQTFQRLAKEAELVDFEVAGDGTDDPDSPQAGLGIWLRFRKENGP